MVQCAAFGTATIPVPLWGTNGSAAGLGGRHARRSRRWGGRGADGREEAGGDRGGGLAAGRVALDEGGDRDVPAEGDGPGVGLRRVAGAVLGGAALARDLAGGGGEGGAGAHRHDRAHELAEG